MSTRPMAKSEIATVHVSSSVTFDSTDLLFSGIFHTPEWYRPESLSGFGQNKEAANAVGEQ